MSRTDFLWVTFLRTYTELLDFAKKYAKESTAAVYVRDALAEVFLMGISGIRTPWGPWAALCESLSSGLERGMHADLAVAAVPDPRAFPVPPVQHAIDVVKAYWALYEAAYAAKLSAPDAMFLASLIAESEPDTQSPATLLELITLGGAHLEPLRRAFWAVEEHECAGGVICRTASRCREEDERKRYRWDELMCREEVNLSWPE